MRRLLPLLVLTAACASAPPPGPVAPNTAAPASSTPPPALSSEKPKAKPEPVVPAAVPPPPPVCATLVAHPTGCTGQATFRAALADALAVDDAVARDAKLACLETSEDAPPGVLRALRAELALEACADALVTPVLQAPPKGMTPEVEQTMLGLLIAGRLSRLLDQPPLLEPPVTKERFQPYFAEKLAPWVLSEAAAIEKLSTDGARLSGYGRGVAAIAAGYADLRFVEMVRQVPLPEEMKADKAVSDAYYGELDQALDPRKTRGRDAALVGLHTFAELGALTDARVVRARELLNRLWAGSRIDSLDRLLLPPLEPLDTSTPELALAARLPTFYAKLLLSDRDPAEPKFLRALLERGVPGPFRTKLGVAKLGVPARVLYARALVGGGRQYFHAGYFKTARTLLGAEKTNDTGALLGGIALALENGPADVAELMLKGPFVRGTGDVSELDAEAQKHGRFAGYAAFDAALVVELAPATDDPLFWEKLAARFDKAEKLLSAAALPDAGVSAHAAHDHAVAARATALAIRAKH
ncbi:MAG TPA: hypothetical protein VGQ57_19810 [Polyangiaceae bacterium]|nr:hypothetical protein [Polyangiaceae bacterium]